MSVFNKSSVGKILSAFLLAVSLTSGFGCSSQTASDSEANPESEFLGEDDSGDASTSETAEKESEVEAEGDDKKTADSADADDFSDEELAQNSDAANGEDQLGEELGGDEFGEEEPKAIAQDESKSKKKEAKDQMEDFDQQLAQESTDAQPPIAQESVAQEPVAQEPAPASEPPPVDVATAPTSDMGQEDPLIAKDDSAFESNPPAEEATPLFLPVVKIKSTPFYKNGTLLNAVYIGRPGDTVQTASQKIYGSDRSAQIIGDNPWLDDGIKTGEKLYYNSPQRPSDNTAILTFYEDSNMTPQNYVTQGSENIRTVSAKLLGYPDAWKEIWATNPAVDSKDLLSEGTALRYWPADAVPTPAPQLAMPAPSDLGMPSSLPVADAKPTAVTPQAFNPAAPPPVDPASMAPPVDMAMNSATDAPPQDPLAAANSATAAGDLGSVPGVENMSSQAPTPAQSEVGAGGSTTNMALIGVIALAALAFVVIQIKKSKRTPAHMEYTQV